MQLGLSVTLHRHFGSRYLIDMLHKLGFCSSYTEVQHFEKLTEADRSENWVLHREVLREMLPYFAASGHYLYAKSTYLYLQTMDELEHSNPKVYEMFFNGFHVVHRTEFNWSGIPPDLLIEQELMRFLK